MTEEQRLRAVLDAWKDFDARLGGVEEILGSLNARAQALRAWSAALEKRMKKKDPTLTDRDYARAGRVVLAANRVVRAHVVVDHKVKALRAGYDGEAAMGLPPPARVQTTLARLEAALKLTGALLDDALHEAGIAPPRLPAP